MVDKVLVRDKCNFCKGLGYFGAPQTECSYCHGVGEVPFGSFDLSIELADLITKLDTLDTKMDTLDTHLGVIEGKIDDLE